MKKIVIKGCDARGDGDTPYLSRWYLFKSKYLNIYFHKFHRSDSDELHDHPWSFISISLWRGYIEETYVQQPLTVAGFKTFDDKPFVLKRSLIRKKRRIYPGQIIFRRATHAHRVILINDKPAYTLLIHFGYIREWGFFKKNRWQHWISYFNDNGCRTIK